MSEMLACVFCGGFAPPGNFATLYADSSALARKGIRNRGENRRNWSACIRGAGAGSDRCFVCPTAVMTGGFPRRGRVDVTYFGEAGGQPYTMYALASQGSVTSAVGRRWVEAASGGVDSVRQTRCWGRVNTVGEACFCRGALRGRSPCTREGRRPDRTTAVVSGQ